MKFTSKLKKVFSSSILWIQALLYTAIILLQLFYPKMSWLQMTIASVFCLAILALVIASGFKTDEEILIEKES